METKQARLVEEYRRVLRQAERYIDAADRAFLQAHLSLLESQPAEGNDVAPPALDAARSIDKILSASLDRVGLRGVVESHQIKARSIIGRWPP